MSSFTQALKIEAVQSALTGWQRLLPPGWVKPTWMVAEGFNYAVGSLENPDEIIQVPAGFCFDGASVPLPFRILIPMAHPNYIQAAALHDWMLSQNAHPRLHCDRVFCEALSVLGMADFWRSIMFVAVRIGAARAHLRRILRRLSR